MQLMHPVVVGSANDVSVIWTSYEHFKNCKKVLDWVGKECVEPAITEYSITAEILELSMRTKLS